MAGQVYLKKNAPVILTRTETARGFDMGFSVKFRPRSRDIFPVTNKPNGKDIQLAQHLKHLLKNNENGIMGDVEVIGKISFKEKNVARPNVDNTEDFALSTLRRLTLRRVMEIELRGGLPWLLCKLVGEQCILPKVLITNFHSEKEDDSGFIELQPLEESCKGKMWLEKLALFHKTCAFCLNAKIWDNIFGSTEEKSRSKKGPQLTLVLIMDLSEIMRQNMPIVGPTGKGCRLALCLEEIVNSRRQEIETGKETDVVIVGKTGKEWKAYADYLVQGSPVFGAMLENQGFEEGRSKRVNLPDLEDKEVECLLSYLYYFDMKACWRSVNLTIKILELAERFQIDGLNASMAALILRRPTEDFSIAQGLKLFVVVRHLDHWKNLKLKVFGILKSRNKELANSKEYNNWFVNEPQLAKEMCTAAVESFTSGLLLY